MRIWTDLGRAPRTIDAYARGLAEFLQVCEDHDIDPVTANRGDVAGHVSVWHFCAWMHPDCEHRFPRNVYARSASPPTDVCCTSNDSATTRSPAPTLWPRSPAPSPPGHISYDLRRLKTRGLITRIEGTHRYLVTDHGLDTAKSLTCVQDRVLRCGLAELVTATSTPSPLRSTAAAYRTAVENLTTAA